MSRYQHQKKPTRLIMFYDVESNCIMSSFFSDPSYTIRRKKAKAQKMLSKKAEAIIDCIDISSLELDLNNNHNRNTDLNNFVNNFVTNNNNSDTCLNETLNPSKNADERSLNFTNFCDIRNLLNRPVDA